jgi:hypothetical protein
VRGRWRRRLVTPSTTPVFILVRDRVTSLQALIRWLETAGFEEIYLLDNDSAYPPLLAYLAASPHTVIPLGRNVGKHALWLDRRYRRLIARRPFVLTDPDVVPDPECPLDILERFGGLLGRHTDVTKVGFGLRIDDLPDSYRFKEQVIAWEGQFWSERLLVEPGAYRAAIDTTFALYRRWSSKPPPIDALRTGPPYVARHTTWYLDSESPGDEEKYYAARLQRGTPDSAGTSTWSGETLPRGILDSIARLGRKESDSS